MVACARETSTNDRSEKDPLIASLRVSSKSIDPQNENRAFVLLERGTTKILLVVLEDNKAREVGPRS